MTFSSIKWWNACMLFMLCVALLACGGRMYHTQVRNGVESVYYKDDKGRKRIVYQVTPDGSVTVYDENDPMYKNYAAGQKWSKVAEKYVADLEGQKAERARKAEESRLARIQAIRDAEKRRSHAPIYVKIHPPKIDIKDPASARKTAARIHQAVCDQLAADRIIHVRSRRADVEVFPKVYFKEDVGWNKKSRKVVPVMVFYFEFNVRSNYLPEDTYTFEEHGHWVRNQQIVNDGSKRICKIIKHMIGPNIPAVRHKFL